MEWIKTHGTEIMAERCTEQKTWQAYNFGKRNVFKIRFKLPSSLRTACTVNHVGNNSYGLPLLKRGRQSQCRRERERRGDRETDRRRG